MKELKVYSKTGCVAILNNGGRCNHKWGIAFLCLFAQSLEEGVTLCGPQVVLCPYHWRKFQQLRERKEPHNRRLRVVSGWLGGANEYDAAWSVFSRKRNHSASKTWYALANNNAKRRDAL